MLCLSVYLTEASFHVVCVFALSVPTREGERIQVASFPAIVLHF